MKQGIDRELYNEAKEKRTKKMIEQIHKKNSKMNSSSDNFDEFIGKKKTFKQKSEKSFRRNQRNFEYDYEEDFYEPGY